MVWIIECKAANSLHKTCGNNTSLPSKQKKISHKEALDLTTPKQLWTRKKSNKKIAFQICLTHVLFPKITSIKRQMQRQERTGHYHVHSKEEWNMFDDGVNNRVQSNRQFTQDLRQWHKSSIEAEKNISQGSIGPYNTPKQLRTGKKSNKKIALQICSTHVFNPNIKSKKRQMQRQERTGHFHIHSKEEWKNFYDGVNNRVQSNRQFTQDLRQWHKSSIEEEKNISQGSIGPYNTPKQLWNGEKNRTKKRPFKYVRPMCYSQTSQAKNARRRDRREQVISKSTPKRSGTCFTIVWIFECKATDSLHKTCGNDTSLPSKQKKISHKEALDLTTRQNNSEPGKKRNKKVAFQLCLTHVLFPNITSIKRQMQRQERTGHFHVNSKEEWNMFDDGVNNRVQSNRQFTQDLRQWHKSSIEAEKISHNEALDLTTRQNNCEPGKNRTKKSPFKYVWRMCYSQRSQA